MERFPDDPGMVREGQALVAMARGNMPRVLELSEAMLVEAPDNIQPRILMSTSAAMEEAWPVVDQVVVQTMDSHLETAKKGTFLRELSRSLADLQHYDRARQCLTQAAELEESEPKDAGHHVQTRISLAWLNAQTGQLDEAETILGSLIEDGAGVRAQFGLVYVGLRQGDYDKVIRLGRELMDSGQNMSNLMRYMAVALNEQQKYQEALPYAERASTMDRSYSSQSILAWTLVAGDLDVERGTKIAEEITGGHLRPGESHWRFSEFPSPEHTRGLALLRNGEYGEAIRMLEQAQAKRPDRMAIAADLRRAQEAL